MQLERYLKFLLKKIKIALIDEKTSIVFNVDERK